MARVIDNTQTNEHKIERFSFKVFKSNSHQKYEPKSFEERDNSHETVSSTNDNKSDPQESVDELLKRIEKLTEENLTLQMKLEELEKNFDEKVEQEKESAYQKGREDATKELQEEASHEIESFKTQLINSITKLDETILNQKSSLEMIKDELIELAISIAQKVIKCELEDRSKEIAFNLTKEFLLKIKDATYIIIKANPIDAIYLKERLKEIKKIKIVADDAVNKGGIIILSNIENFDATIQTRVQKVIELIKKEA